MQIPLQITFRGMAHSDAIEAVIRQRATRLERYEHRISRCHVVVDAPHQNHHKGNHYSVRIDMTTPNGELAVTRDPPLDHSHEDFQTVIRDAFDTAARRLEDDAERHRGNTKSPEAQPHRLTPR